VVRDASSVEYCSGETLTMYNANGNSGNGKWLSDCWLTVQSTGATGKVYGTNLFHQWTADGATVNGIAAGVGFPGYNGQGLRQAQDSETGVTFDDTTSKTLHVEERSGTSSSLTLKLEQFSIDILLP